MSDEIQYITAESLAELKKEYDILKDKTIPEIAKRIDEAKQQGDLSENAEYHQAREDMSWAKGRLAELGNVVNNAQVITVSKNKNIVTLGSTIVVEVNKNKREYTIVGPQEAKPALGRISNESPLGRAFLGCALNEKVEIEVPSGKQTYKIVEIK